MNAIFRAAREIEEFCRARAWGFCIIGGLAVQRATPYEVAPNVELTTCSAEDLVVLKAFAGRDRDWVDVEGIVNRQGSRLDDTLVWRELLPLLDLKEDRDAAPRLRRLLGDR